MPYIKCFAVLMDFARAAKYYWDAVPAADLKPAYIWLSITLKLS